MRFEELVSILDVLTCVEVVKTGYGVLFKGRLRDINPIEMTEYRVYKVLPCATSRETYLEIDVY
jgi:hypothetical protein